MAISSPEMYAKIDTVKFVRAETIIKLWQLIIILF